MELGPQAALWPACSRDLQRLFWESLSVSDLAWKEQYSPVRGCICVCVHVCVCVHPETGWAVGVDMCTHLSMSVFQIPRKHWVHSAKLLGPASVALLRNVIAFQMLLSLVFSFT